MGLIAVAAGIGYAFYQIDQIDQWWSSRPASDSEAVIIDLPLPPPAGSKRDPNAPSTSSTPHAPTTSPPGNHDAMATDVDDNQRNDTAHARIATVPPAAAPVDRSDALTDASEQALDNGTDASNKLSRISQATRQARTVKHKILSGQTLSAIFSLNGFDPGVLQNLLAALGRSQVQRLERLRLGDELTLEIAADGTLAEMRFALDPLHTLRIEHASGVFVARVDTLPTERRQRTLTAVVDRSLYRSARVAGIPDSITKAAIDVFRSRIDFAKVTRPGDRLTVVFEQEWLADKPIASGALLAVEISNRGKRHSAVRYTPKRGKSDFYSADGEPINRSRYGFLRAPVKYTRISSTFSSRRLHPILLRVRPHTGVDFAAPAGRPVVATAVGTTEFKGRKSGYGNVLIIRHGGKYKTVYGHLSRFAKDLKVGQKVERGQTIGYVGQTGLATGPHVHYEIRTNGKPVDPLSADAPFLDPLSPGEKARFDHLVRPLLAALDKSSAAPRVVRR